MDEWREWYLDQIVLHPYEIAPQLNKKYGYWSFIRSIL